MNSSSCFLAGGGALLAEEVDTEADEAGVATGRGSGSTSSTLVSMGRTSASSKSLVSPASQMAVMF